MNTNYGLTYTKETDFYDINIFNSNFSALADGIDSAKNITVKGNHEIVIASENSSERVKKVADFICSAEDSSIVFQNAINAVEVGCSIFVASGYYKFKSTVNINKTLYIHGCNNSTNLYQAGADSVKAIFNITAKDVELKNLKFADSKGNSSEPLLYIQAENVVIDTCWFEQYQNTKLSVNAIYFKNCSALMRIVNCCFAKMENDSATVINCKSVNSAGIISGNYCLSNNYMGNMPVKISVKDSLSKSRLITGNQNTEFV